MPNPAELGYYVSIHASAREATVRRYGRRRQQRVSIHASAREATHPRFKNIKREHRFNPRLREGGDDLRQSVTPANYMFQSTPPRGRRRALPHRPPNRKCFNPRLREGGDMERSEFTFIQRSFNPRLREGGDEKLSRPLTPLQLFQSTPPRGRRHTRGWCGHYQKSFNPRLREGGDCFIDHIRRFQDVSIHASAREATGVHVMVWLLTGSFNPRLREGGDMVAFLNPPLTGCFNPRLREGGDLVNSWHAPR